MSVWEKYQAERSQSAQENRKAQLARIHDEVEREFEARRVAKEQAESQITEERKTRAMSMINKSSTLGELNEIRSHIPGAKVQIRDRGEGYLTASLEWEGTRTTTHVYPDLKKKEDKVHETTYGIKVEYQEPTPNTPEGCLVISGIQDGHNTGFAENQDELENCLVKTLKTEIAATGIPTTLVHGGCGWMREEKWTPQNPHK